MEQWVFSKHQYAVYSIQHSRYTSNKNHVPLNWCCQEHGLSCDSDGGLLWICHKGIKITLWPQVESQEHIPEKLCLIAVLLSKLIFPTSRKIFSMSSYFNFAEVEFRDAGDKLARQILKYLHAHPKCGLVKLFLSRWWRSYIIVLLLQHQKGNLDLLSSSPALEFLIRDFYSTSLFNFFSSSMATPSWRQTMPQNSRLHVWNPYW